MACQLQQPQKNCFTYELFSKSINDSVSSNNCSGNGREEQLIQTFLSHVDNTVAADNLLCFTLRGPTKKAFNSSSTVRGSVRMITGRPIKLNRKTMVHVTFKYHGATDICKNWDMSDCSSKLESILMSRDRHFSDAVIPASEWGLPPAADMEVTCGIQSATLQTKNGITWELRMDLGTSKLSERLSCTQVTQKRQHLQTQDHDRLKKRLVDFAHPVWQALGATSVATGTVKLGMSSKLRQCQKFVEIVDRLISEYRNTIPEWLDQRISVVDMGCGRGYLTFALHSFLFRLYGERVSSRGIDVRPKLIKEISDIALSLGSEFNALRFETGTIEGVLAETAPSKGVETSMDILIALHACDTATDDALWSGISREADIIVVAPCCHRQVRTQLNQHVAAVKNMNHPYEDVLRHNIYRERVAEIVTDSMRSLLLELTGYSVQVFEFVGGEHTSKNVMITAVKRRQKWVKRNFAKEELLYRERLARIRTLAKSHGIQNQKLAEWMDVALSINVIGPQQEISPRIIPGTMPPLEKKH